MKKHFYLFILTLSDDFQQLINLDNWFLNRLALNLNFYIGGLRFKSKHINHPISLLGFAETFNFRNRSILRATRVKKRFFVEK